GCCVRRAGRRHGYGSTPGPCCLDRMDVLPRRADCSSKCFYSARQLGNRHGYMLFIPRLNDGAFWPAALGLGATPMRVARCCGGGLPPTYGEGRATERRLGGARRASICWPCSVEKARAVGRFYGATHVLVGEDALIQQQLILLHHVRQQHFGAVGVDGE